MRWFETILVVLTLATGLVWALDKFVWRKRRNEGNELLADEKESWVVETARSFFPVLAIVLMLRTFVAEPFRIPSGSMIPSLHIGDFILVNKFSYGLRLPITNTKFLSIGEPKRGDVAVFKFPGRDESDPEKGVDYVKRVIGLPGDKISYHMGILQVNGVPVQYQTSEVLDADQGGISIPSERRIEALPGHAPHPILISRDSLLNGAMGDTDVIVPAGHYFMMGDNRDNSLDGRFWGMLPEANLRGRAMFVWMNFGDFKRIGTRVP